MDYFQLSGDEFELLCARLLRESGFTLVQQTPRFADMGVDFTFTDATGTSWVAEVKRFGRRTISAAGLRQTAVQLSSAKQISGAARALLIVSMLLPTSTKEDLERREQIEIWDARRLNELLSRHPDIETDFQSMLDARSAARRLMDAPAQLESRASELISRLEALEPGRARFRDYEDLCVEILNYVFIPELSVPSVQSRTEDGLDIRDAVYPMSGNRPFWQELKRICPTRFVIAEFKNYADPIRQGQVESIQQYLYTKAMRMFGLLCSRLPASDSALAARRRAWVEMDKLILFLSDEDLKDLVRARSAGDDPTQILDAQLQEFFLRLAP
jgi:hypothetical protein